jgi:Ca2+/Na+ antiporter
MFFLGIILLVKGADFMVHGAESLAVRIGVSRTTIGLTVLAFGTSLPELVVSTEAFWLGDYAHATCSRICPISRFSALWICSSSVVLCMPIFSASSPAFIFQG